MSARGPGVASRPGRSRGWRALVWAPLLLAACPKVPLTDVEAGFELADISWFAEEQTLFVFYEVEAEQGIGEHAQIEIAWTTDAVRQDWTPLQGLNPVHTHLPVDCGVNARCGSFSLAIPDEPRDVALRLRYHPDGAMALDADTVFNVVGPGPAHTHRSLLVYGVFDGENQRVQWRARHRFPTLRNEQAQHLGLRRAFTVAGSAWGDIPADTPQNPYLYGVNCPENFVPTGLGPVHTEARAVFQPDPLPVEASAAAGLCAWATVFDATGPFATGAVARKNPEVRPAFPELRSPVEDALQLRFFLAPCERQIAPEHAAMQRQRLFLDGAPTVCTEGWQSPGFVDGLIATLRDAVEAARPAGRDMVLVIGLHQDEPGLSGAVEQALAVVVPPERHLSTPRLAGAFVFDSAAHAIGSPALQPTTLWCPASPLGVGPSQSCATAPDFPGINLGPFTFNQLPILPTRTNYLQFIDTFSEAQAGEMTALELLTPEFATTAEHVDLGPFGVVTFLNGETFGADPDDAFSHCASGEPAPVVFRSPWMQRPEVLEALREACAFDVVDSALCAVAQAGVLPLESLPAWHSQLGESSYALGLFWEFPFLLRLEYRSVVAGTVGALGFSVPFGFASTDESYHGTATWMATRFDLAERLLQCTRFCDHPTFDGAGIYQIGAPFRARYAQDCYRPLYPANIEFPRDP